MRLPTLGKRNLAEWRGSWTFAVADLTGTTPSPTCDMRMSSLAPPREESLCPMR
jgi:hypothetical protein